MDLATWLRAAGRDGDTVAIEARIAHVAAGCVVAEEGGTHVRVLPSLQDVRVHGRSDLALDLQHLTLLSFADGQVLEASLLDLARMWRFHRRLSGNPAALWPRSVKGGSINYLTCTFATDVAQLRQYLNVHHAYGRPVALPSAAAVAAYHLELSYRWFQLTPTYASRPLPLEEFVEVRRDRPDGHADMPLDEYVTWYLNSRDAHVLAPGIVQPASLNRAVEMLSLWGLPLRSCEATLYRALQVHPSHYLLFRYALECAEGGEQRPG